MNNQLHALGASGLSVSRIGLGLAALGRPGYINLGHGTDLAHTYTVASMEQQAFTVLDAAWQAGIRYFDAARSYGRAEEFLGNWLRSRAIASTVITVGSKWGYTYTADWQITAPQHEVKAHTLPVLQRQWDESQATIGTHLKLYQIHSATLESGVLENRAVLSELARLKQGGMRIGLSLSGVAQAATLERALAIELDGVRLFDAVQATWNLLERSAGLTLAAAHAAGLGVIVKEALANGRLTQRNDDPNFVSRLAQLKKTATRLQTSVDALALAAVLAQPWADVVLSGAATVAQLQSNLHTLDVAWDAQADEELAGLMETPGDYWQTRSQLAWN